MLHFPELVQDCKPDIVAGTAACDEVRKGLFQNVLFSEFILVVRFLLYLA